MMSGRQGLFAVALLVVSSPAWAAPRDYVLDPAASSIEIHVGKTGLFGFAGHEHVVVVGAGALRGLATVDPGRPGEARVDLIVDAGGLNVASAGEPAGDVPQVQAAMIGPGCLDVRRFPAIHFVSRSAAELGPAAGGGREVELRGDLTLHGVTRPLVLRVHVNVTPDALEASGRTTLRQTDFGIMPISKAGVVKVKDELTLSWHIRGHPR